MRIHELTQQYTQRCASRFPQRWLTVLVSLMLFTTTAGGQTLFARPDTTPDYASYQHIEECMSGISRIAEAKEFAGQKIWWDTIGVAQEKALRGGAIHKDWERIKNDAGEIWGNIASPRARPDAAIQAGRVCLAQFNADTATFKSAGYALTILDALLMANRDEDASRFTERFLDSMRARSATEYKDALQDVLVWYIQAAPTRYAEAKQYYARILTTVAGDSLYRVLEADKWLSWAAKGMGDTAYENALAWHAIRINDAMPVQERFAGGSWRRRLEWMEEKLAEFTREEGFDSLKISTLASNMYYANSVKRRIWGGEPVTATDAAVQPYKVPDLVGEHYYTSTIGASSGPSGQMTASYIKQGAVPPGTLPVKGRINLIYSLPSICHKEGKKRPPEAGRLPNGNALGCTRTYTRLRRAKELYPDLEIIVLSDTYGTVGQLGPLKPADEADTLAKLFLGHGRVPAHLIVESTPFFHVDAPDGRRIDLPTPQMEVIGLPRTLYSVEMYGLFWLVDKEGYVVRGGIGGSGAGSGDHVDRMYTILKNRPSK